MLGEELFYILFIPLSAWVISTQFAAHITILLAMSVGIGNILKNFFLIPRPPHPPVWAHTESEKDHGLPSTHTMTAITLPWYFIVFHHYLEPIYPIHPSVFVLAFVWTVSVMVSRLYNGHHTVMDVIAGAILGVGFLLVFTFQLRPLVDSLLVSDTWTVVFTVVGTGVSILALHPVPPKVLTPAHAETGLVVGTSTGSVLGLWWRGFKSPRHIYSLFFSTLTVPHPEVFVANTYVLYLLRFVVGAVTVVLIRFVVKKVATMIVLWVARMLNPKYAGKTAFKYSEAEVAVKYITYSAIGFGAVYLVPLVFVFTGLHHPLDDNIIDNV
jgi:membrane-associated phospholipid phosphatase